MQGTRPVEGRRERATRKARCALKKENTMRKLHTISIEARIVMWNEEGGPIWNPTFILRWDDGSMKYHQPAIYEPTWGEAIQRAEVWLIEHNTFVV
jgi:hypothetical protein